MSRQIASDIFECGIIVLLSDRSKTAEKLRSSGQDARADYIIEYDQEKNREIIQLFSNACSFTNVYFTYKKNLDKLDQGISTGIFLNKDLSISDQSLDCDNFYYIEKGAVEIEDRSDRADDWIVKDIDLTPVSRPFPWRVNYPLDCLGKGKKTEIDCLCYQIYNHLIKS